MALRVHLPLKSLLAFEDEQKWELFASSELSIHAPFPQFSSGIRGSGRDPAGDDKWLGDKKERGVETWQTQPSLLKCQSN